MAMLHEDDRWFFKSSPLTFAQITALFESKLPSERITNISSPAAISAEYHKIYLIELASGRGAVLRVARPCIPHIKLENEVAVLAYVTRHCPNVPVPRVWFWSADDNQLGYEYMVMDWINGRSLDREWRNLPEEVVDKLFDQVAEYWLALREISMGQVVGGLKFGRTPSGTVDENVIEPGPVVEETCWQTPDVKRYWNDLGLQETFSSLNIDGPYPDYRRYIQAHLHQYFHIVSVHPALKFARHFLPRIGQLIDNLDDETFVYTRAAIAVKIHLGHHDAHLGNMLFEGESIVAVIDWEFSGLLPSFDTNPTPPLLWVDKEFPPKPSDREQRPVTDLWQQKFEDIVAARAPKALKELVIPSDVANVRHVWNWLRCICEVAPRGARMELACGSWSGNLDKSLISLGL